MNPQIPHYSETVADALIDQISDDDGKIDVTKVREALQSACEAGAKIALRRFPPGLTKDAINAYPIIK